jgi:hypothetical protein
LKTTFLQELKSVNLVRIGKIIINFEHVTDIVPGDPAGPDPESLIVNMVTGKTFTFTGDQADGLRAFIERTVKTAVKPLEDFIVN